MDHHIENACNIENWLIDPFTMHIPRKLCANSFHRYCWLVEKVDLVFRTTTDFCNGVEHHLSTTYDSLIMFCTASCITKRKTNNKLWPNIYFYNIWNPISFEYD